MSNKNIIGLTGKAGSGKDTFASFYKDAECFAFAAPLKEAAKILFNLEHDQLHHPDKKDDVDTRWGKSPRYILQWLGTNVLRDQFDDKIFLKNMKQRIDNAKGSFIIITDVRFDNEAEFVKSLGGKIIHIERDNNKSDNNVNESNESDNNGDDNINESDNQQAVKRQKMDLANHVSEKGISKHFIDFTIKNDSTIDAFKEKAIEIIQ